ncbi:hypothetical protein LCGC14_1101000 [marine sediment metagenome]|uniref:Uncharacterized protein n=1 Tax=marine sediment metagenome TaxID=412755 RepID=A0A0F9QFL2_9ZZZZ
MCWNHSPHCQVGPNVWHCVPGCGNLEPSELMRLRAVVAGVKQWRQNIDARFGDRRDWSPLDFDAFDTIIGE